MKKEIIPPTFCPLCAKHKDDIFTTANFGPIRIDICKDCNVVVFNLDRIIKDTKRKMTNKIAEDMKIAH